MISFHARKCINMALSVILIYTKSVCLLKLSSSLSLKYRKKPDIRLCSLVIKLYNDISLTREPQSHPPSFPKCSWMNTKIIGRATLVGNIEFLTAMSLNIRVSLCVIFCLSEVISRLFEEPPYTPIASIPSGMCLTRSPNPVIQTRPQLWKSLPPPLAQHPLCLSSFHRSISMF